IIGHAAGPSFAYHSVPFSDLAADFSWDGEHIFVHDFRVRHESGQLSAELFDAPGDFRLNLHSTMNPAGLKPLVPAGSREFFNEWEWQRSPAIDLIIRGHEHDPNTWQGEGTIALDRTRFRGIWLNKATSRIRFGD